MEAASLRQRLAAAERRPDPAPNTREADGAGSLEAELAAAQVLALSRFPLLLELTEGPLLL